MAERAEGESVEEQYATEGSEDSCIVMTME